VTDLTIITNNVPRDIVDAWELTADERAEFNYLDWPAIDDGRDSATFVRYKGELIDLGDLDGSTRQLPDDHPLRAWDAYRSDSFFSGIALRYASEDGRDDWDRVIVARYYS
jgi:hypothetical protein